MSVPPSGRGSGRTTKQIKEAAQRAYYIVLHSNEISYTKQIAYANGRQDLRFDSVEPFFLNGQKYRGLLKSQVVIDHHVWEDLSGEQYDRLHTIVSQMHD